MRKILLALILVFPLSSNAQNFWTEAFRSPGDYYVADISIVDESTVWVTQTDLDITGRYSVWRWARSTDGGLTWTQGWFPDDVVFPTMSDQHITNINALSDQTAYVGAAVSDHNGTRNKLLVTHDAGNTWTQIHPELFSDGYYSYIRGVHFFDNDHGVAVGDPVDNSFEIHTTADAAVTWTRTTSTNIPASLPNEYILINPFDTTAGIIRFITSKGRLFSSRDQGLNWTVSQTPDNPWYGERYGDFFFNRTFSFKNADEGILVTAGDTPAAYQTTDGGNTWNPVTTTGNLSDRSVTYVPQTSGTYYNTGNLSYPGTWSTGYSTDNGNSWTAMTDDPNFQPIITEFLSPTVGYASGYVDRNPDYYIGLYRLTDTFNRLLKNKSFLETSFNAAPNPTKNIFKISGSAITSVVIQDATGKEIYRRPFARTDQAEFDLSGFRTGIYFANIANDNGSKTIKIVKN